MDQKQLVSKNISYSLLSSFIDNGPEILINKKTIFNKGIDFGTKLDDFITLSKDDFNNKYHILSTDIKLSTDYETLISLLITNKIELNEINLKKIYDLIIINNLFKKITIEKSRYNKLNDFLSDPDVKIKYDLSLENKSVLTASEYTKLLQCKNILFNHKNTKKYFQDFNEEIDVFYQLKLEYKIKNKNCKVILDKVIVNHKNKTIQGLDIKTGSVTSEEFMKNFFNFKYYLQGALYQKGMEELKNKYFKDYTILSFKFLYLPTYNINNPKIFVLTQKWIDAAWNGFKTNYGKYYKGIYELIEEILWHIDNKIFNESKEFHLNEEIILDDSFIHLN